MKTKNFSNKLKLSKETIANLNKSEMKAVYGGEITGGHITCRIDINSGCPCIYSSPTKPC